MGNRMKAAGRDRENPSFQALLLESQLCFPLYTASRLLTQAYQAPLESLDLTYPQYLAMLVLWEQDGLKVSDLGERLHLDSGTLSPLLKKLESKGLLVRRRSPEDERSVLLHLTPQGRALRIKAVAVPSEMGCRSGLANQDAKVSRMKRDLHELIETLRATLEGSGGPD